MTERPPCDPDRSTYHGGRGGEVYLVGAGPGDPELLTVKAYRLLREADAVLHDALVSESILADLPDSVEVVDVGKRPGPDGKRTTQAEINREMVQRARRGEQVVRLKCGDPTIFGRGGEEAEFLAAKGVGFETVPGISSAVAAPEVAGVPLTHREYASSLTIVTGHEDPSKPESALDWEALAKTVSAGGTLVVLMGVRRAAEYCKALAENGLAPETPAAMIERATHEDEYTVAGTVETLPAEADRVGISPPAATVIGDVVSVREQVRDALREAPPSPSNRSRRSLRGVYADD
jgi:uroporphyrin-III C-methyltransferase